MRHEADCGDSRRIAWALALTAGYFFAELIGGYLTNSLALLSDAGHMFSDIGALGFTDDGAFCRFLTTELGVAAIPTSAFFSDPASATPLARFCFAKRRETLEAAGERLRHLRERI